MSSSKMRRPPKTLLFGPLDTYDEVWYGHDVTGGYWWIGLEQAEDDIRVRGASDKASAGFSSAFASIDQARKYLRSRFPDVRCERAGQWPDAAGFVTFQPVVLEGKWEQLELF